MIWSYQWRYTGEADWRYARYQRYAIRLDAAMAAAKWMDVSADNNCIVEVRLVIET